MAQVAMPPRPLSTDAPSKMSSPTDIKRSLPKPEDHSDNASPQKKSPPQPVQPVDSEADAKPAVSNGQPLGPPPKPSDADYFNQTHGASHFNLEPNPFEAQFGVGSNNETSGKSLLPPVASLTSPSSLLPGGTPGWAESLRAGPLSPAMLPGPTGTNDYFGQNFRGSFPTPNESSLRTGLTPGGGGSMFPAASPNSQFLNGLPSGGATPGTLDFHRTALNAAAAKNGNSNNYNVTSNAISTTQPEANQFAAMEQQRNQRQPAGDPYGHDANDAANGLYMLAQQSTGPRNGTQFGQSQPGNIQTNLNDLGNQSVEPSPLSRRGANKGSVGSLPASLDMGDGSDSGNSEQKPATRNRGKKASGNGKAANNRRKADDTPAKAPAAKKAKANSGMPTMDDEDSEDESMMPDVDANGRKMTDEEKRKNFLERNRIAALKCRQRKKQWLQNLQNKVELYSAENDALSGQVQQLREEVVNLKTLLLAHKDCPVAGQQGLNGMNMHAYLEQGTTHPQANPYGLGQVPQGMATGLGMPMPQGQAAIQRSRVVEHG